MGGIVHRGPTAARKRCSPGFFGLHHPVQNLAQTLIRAIPRKYLHRVFQRTVKLFIVQRLCQIEKTPGMPGLLAGENIEEIHELTSSFRVIFSRMVMNSIRRVQVSVRRSHATIEAR